MQTYPQTISDESLDLQAFEKVTEVLCSRICHDLISPMGAVKNALELMDGNHDLGSEVHTLLQQSTSQALDKLSIYRVAFGLNGASMMNSTERFAEIMLGFEKAFKFKGTIKQGLLDTLCPEHMRPMGQKLVVHLLLVLSEIVPFGCELETLAFEQGIEINAKGRLFTLKGDYAQALKDGVKPDDATPQNIFIYYLMNSLERLNIKMELEHDGVDRVKIQLKPLVSLAQSDLLF